jgi:phosphatidylserine/phosphatidylglycerophosphate/cardiolipin synthase-like enzyme
MTEVEILATGQELFSKGVRGFEPVMEETVKNAQKEIQVVAYLMTRQALKLLDLLEGAAERGIRVTLIVNRISGQDSTIVARLAKISSRYGHFKVLNFTDKKGRQLHAKIVVVDRKRALVGSANFSWGGMFSNYEIGLAIQGRAAWKLAAVVDDLATASGVSTWP